MLTPPSSHPPLVQRTPSTDPFSYDEALTIYWVNGSEVTFPDYAGGDPSVDSLISKEVHYGGGCSYYTYYHDDDNDGTRAGMCQQDCATPYWEKCQSGMYLSPAEFSDAFSVLLKLDPHGTNIRACTSGFQAVSKIYFMNILIKFLVQSNRVEGIEFDAAATNIGQDDHRYHQQPEQQLQHRHHHRHCHYHHHHQYYRHCRCR